MTKKAVVKTILLVFCVGLLIFGFAPRSWATDEIVDVDSSGANMLETEVQTSTTSLIGSGVFRIKETATNDYLSYAAIDGGRYMSWMTSDAAPGSDERYALFKITRRSSGTYIIRSMMNNDVSFFASIGESAGAMISNDLNGAADDSVPLTNVWRITAATSTGHYISYTPTPTAETYYLQKLSNYTIALTTNMFEATVWEFSSYTTSMEGVSAIVPECTVITSGSSIDLWESANDAVFYSSVIGRNVRGALSFSVTNVDPETATSIATISSNGVLTTVAGKTGTVKVRFNYTSGASFPITFYIAPNNNDNFFMLQNDDEQIGYMTAGGAGIVKNSFTYGDNQLWEWIPHSGLWFKIRNVATGQYLVSPSSSSSGEAITLDDLSSSESVYLWRKVPAASGTGGMKIQSKYMQENNSSLCLVVTSSGAFVQGVYTNDTSFADEFNIVAIGTDVLYNRSLTWSSSIDPSIVTSNLAKYYDSYMLAQADVYLDTLTTRELLDNAKIAIFNGHGSPTAIAIHEFPQRFFTCDDICDPDDPSHALDLTNVDIVIYAGCSTAENPCDHCNELGKLIGHSSDCPGIDPDLYNLPEISELQGAKVAIGWAATTYENYMNDWIDLFMDLLNNTINPETNQIYTAYEAWDKANKTVTEGNANYAVIHGTDIQYRLSQ